MLFGKRIQDQLRPLFRLYKETWENMGSLFLDPEDVRSLKSGAIWNFIKETELP